MTTNDGVAEVTDIPNASADQAPPASQAMAAPRSDESMRGLRVFARAFRRRCPNCGAGPLTVRWFGLQPWCPACRFRPERGEEDFFLGAMVFNMAFAEGLFAVGLVAALVLTWPDPPWTAIYVVGSAAMIAAPIILYPYSKLCWLAFDLLCRPPRPEDFAPEPGAIR